MKKKLGIVILLIMVFATIGLTGCTQPAAMTPVSNASTEETGAILSMKDFKAAFEAGKNLLAKPAVTAISKVKAAPLALSTFMQAQTIPIWTT